MIRFALKINLMNKDNVLNRDMIFDFLFVETCLMFTHQSDKEK